MMRMKRLLLALLLFAGSVCAQTTVTIGENTGNTYSGSRLFELNQGDPTTAYWGTSGRLKKGLGSNEELSLSLFPGLTNIAGPVTVTSATLYIYQTTTGDQTAITIAGHLLKRAPVYDQATWNVYSTGNNWGTGGAYNDTSDREGTAFDTSPALNGAGYIAFTSAQLATDIQTAINAAAGTIGFQLVSDDLFSRITVAYEADSDGQRPYLEFTYTAAGSSGLLRRRRGH